MPKKILVVDDEPDVLKVICYSLLKEGYVVLTAEHGKQAIETTKLERPDLILLDFLMPEMDGFEVCRRLKLDATLKAIPVILMTANKDTHLDKRFLPAAINDHIIKPFEAEELFAKVKKFIC